MTNFIMIEKKDAYGYEKMLAAGKVLDVLDVADENSEDEEELDWHYALLEEGEIINYLRIEWIGEGLGMIVDDFECDY